MKFISSSLNCIMYVDVVDIFSFYAKQENNAGKYIKELHHLCKFSKFGFHILFNNLGYESRPSIHPTLECKTMTTGMTVK